MTDEQKVEDLEQRIENLENFIETSIDEKIEEVEKPSNIERYAKDYALSKLEDLKDELKPIEES